MSPRGETDTLACLARIDERVAGLQRSVDELKEKIERDFVTRDQFGPVQKIVYGGVGIILTACLVALIGLVVATAPIKARATASPAAHTNSTQQVAP